MKSWCQKKPSDGWHAAKEKSRQVKRTLLFPLMNVLSTRPSQVENLEVVALDSNVEKDEERSSSPEAGISADTEIITVGSGKGGVGKSTITANLAVALAQMGNEVAVLDADIYGFSIPRLLGVEGRPEAVDEETMLPLRAKGLKVMSMGFFVPEGSPVIWRGPLLIKAMDQFLNDVVWGSPDFLVVDLPPGTGDVPLTVAQKLPDSGLLLVTTPQPLATNVAVRAGMLGEKTDLKILGVVENMSWMQCPHCDEEISLFGSGGGESLADALDVELLAKIPFDPQMRESGDRGKTVLEVDEGSEAQEQFAKLAENLARR